MSITYVQSKFQSSSAGTFGAFANPVAVGDLIVVRIYIAYVGTQITPVISDTVNTGNYTIVDNQYNGNQRQFITAYMVCNAAGTPTINCAAANGTTANYFAVHFNGFVGTATLANHNYTDQETGTTSIAATTFNTSNANEMVTDFYVNFNGYSWTTNPTASGWTELNGTNTANDAFYQLFATSGTAAGISGTASGSAGYIVMQLGFYDAATAPTISVVPSSANYVNAGTSPCTMAYGASLAIGNVGIVGVQDKSGNHTINVSDNLNGTYTKIYSAYNATLGGVQSFWFVKVQTPGTPTVTVAGNVGDSLILACLGLTGFIGNPAIDGPVQANFSGTSTTAVSMTPIQNNFAEEILLVSNLSTSYIASGFSGWSEMYSGQAQFFYSIEGPAGTSNPFSATMAAAANWAGIAAGLYDSGLIPVPGPVPRQIYILP